MIHKQEIEVSCSQQGQVVVGYLVSGCEVIISFFFFCMPDLI